MYCGCNPENAWWSNSASREVLSRMSVAYRPGWLPLESSVAMLSLFDLARRSSRSVVICGSAGTGKSCAAQEYLERTSGCWLMSLSPDDEGKSACLQRLAAIMCPERGADLKRAFRWATRHEPGLLVIDNAQHLSHAAEARLLQTRDLASLGIVFLLTTKGDPGASFRPTARVFPKLWLSRPLTADVDHLAQAWGVTGREARAHCRAVARMPGGLWNLVRLVGLAQALALESGSAIGPGDALAPEHVKNAWRRLRQQL
jgi:hypothetical protein